jgi:hypothetical protein
MQIVAIILGVSILSLLLFLRYYPAFGAKWSGDKVVNEVDIGSNTIPGTTLSILKDFIRGNPNSKPSQPISIFPADLGRSQ